MAVSRSVLLALLLSVPALAQAVPLLAEDRLRLGEGLPPAVDVLLGDIDGDGRLDLVRAAADSISVLLQTPAGEFQHHPLQGTLRFPGAAIRGLAFARIRPAGTGKDLVVTRTTMAPLVLGNDGSGGYAPLSLGLPPPPAPVAAVLVGDLDRVAPDDLVVLPDLGRPQLLLGQSTGYRDASQLFAAGLLVQAPIGVLADFDVDGDLDIGLASGAGATPFLIENTGVFTRQIPLPLTGSYGSIAAGDFDGDARPDLAFARAAPLPGIEFVLNRAGGRIAYTPAAPIPLDAVATHLRPADVQPDGHLDLVVLQADGRVRVGLGDGQPAFTFVHPSPPPLAPAPRGGFAVADLEGDGDADMVVAGTAAASAAVRDSVLLAHGATVTWLDTERVGFPIGILPGATAGAAVDWDGDAEQDVVVYSAAGQGFAFRNDGTARFSERQAVLPALPMREVRKVLGASIDTPERDLVVVASAAGGTALPPGLRLLLAQGGLYVDATARLPGLVGRGFADVALARVLLPAGGTRRIDDLVLADAAGNLAVIANLGGLLSEVAGAFAPSVAAAPVRAVLSGDVDGDLRPDIMLLEHGRNGGALEVFLRTATNTPPLFVLAPPLAVTFGAVARALGGDFDGDSDLDIVAALENGAPVPLLFLAGDGRGGFTDATAAVFTGPLPATVDAIAVIGAPQRLPSLLLGSTTGEPLLMLRRIGGGYGPPEVQAVHGSPRVNDLVVSDLDTDGDDDCIVLPLGARPGLLLGTDLQLASTAVFQAGREIVLRARGPDPAAVAAWLWSPAGPARWPFPGLGIVRLLPPIHSLAVFPIGPSLLQDIAFPAPRLASDTTLFFQLAVFDPRTLAVRLSNLEPTLITAR